MSEELSDKELEEIRERKKQRLLEESKQISIDEPIPLKMVKCPKCHSETEVAGFVTLLGKKVQFVKCTDCRAQIIPNIENLRICIKRGEDKPRLINKNDCKTCKLYPKLIKKGMDCPHFRQFSQYKQLITSLTGWEKV